MAQALLGSGTTQLQGKLREKQRWSESLGISCREEECMYHMKSQRGG